MMKIANAKAVLIPIALAAFFALPTGCSSHKDAVAPVAAPPVPSGPSVNDPRLSPQAREALKRNMAQGAVSVPKAQ